MTTPARVAFGRDQHMLAQGRKTMTTEWTAIRRGLAVRREAHRPPWRGRQAGHRSIVAPFAATIAVTVAATVFVGVGAALAKAERERRCARLRRRDRQLGLRAGEPLATAMQRMALAQADLAIELLGGGQSANGTHHAAAPDENAVHETRKALKRLRALVALLAGELGEQAVARENRALRDVGRSLAGARDAEVMLGTLDGLIEHHPRKLARRGGVRRLRARLAAEHERSRRQTLGEPAALAQALVQLRAFRVRASAWSLSERAGIELVQDDLQRLYQQGRRRRRRAARTDGTDMQAMHRWRKRVKDLRYAAEMLDRPSLARRADSLGETLGEDHDLAVLAQRIRTDAKRAKGSQRVGRRTRKLLLGLIAKRRRKLQRQALREGRRLYADSPKEFLRRAQRRARSR
jgi:CHAD domain-containing protein